MLTEIVIPMLLCFCWLYNSCVCPLHCSSFHWLSLIYHYLVQVGNMLIAIPDLVYEFHIPTLLYLFLYFMFSTNQRSHTLNLFCFALLQCNHQERIVTCTVFTLSCFIELYILPRMQECTMFTISCIIEFHIFTTCSWHFNPTRI